MTEIINSAAGQTDEELNELMQARRDKLTAIVGKGIEPFGRHYDASHHAQEILGNFEQLEGKKVRVAGRLMAIRGHGKAACCTSSWARACAWGRRTWASMPRWSWWRARTGH